MLFSSFYELLGVPVHASRNDIRTAYAKQVKLWQSQHKIFDNDTTTVLDDNAEAHDTWRMQVEQAHRVLSNDRMRRVYDRYLLENSSRHIPSMQLRCMRRTFPVSLGKTATDPHGGGCTAMSGGGRGDSRAEAAADRPTADVRPDSPAHVLMEPCGVATDAPDGACIATAHHRDARRERSTDANSTTGMSYSATRRASGETRDGGEAKGLAGVGELPRRVRVFEQQLAAGRTRHDGQTAMRPGNSFEDSGRVVDANSNASQ